MLVTSRGLNPTTGAAVMKYLRAALAVLMIVCAQAASAQDDQARRDVAALMDLSGLSTIIESIPRNMSQSITNEDYLDLSDLSRDDINTLKDILSTTFDTKELQRDIGKQLVAEYTPKRTGKVLALFRAPLARKINGLEEQANSPGAAKDFEQFVAGLALHAPDPDRVELLKQLDQVSHSTEIAIVIQIEIAKTLVQSVSVFDANRRPLSAAQMNDLVLALKDQLSITVRNHILIWSLYAYRSLTDKELKTYIKMYRRDEMQWFIRMSSAALVKAMGRAAENAGRSISTLRNAQQI